MRPARATATSGPWSPMNRCLLTDDGIKVVGDLHLGKVFMNGVPLARRGERERLQRQSFFTTPGVELVGPLPAERVRTAFSTVRYRPLQHYIPLISVVF